MIRPKALGGHFIAMLRTLLSDTSETGTNFNTLYSVNAHHGVGNISIQFVVQRRTQTHRYPSGLNTQACPARIAGLSQGVHVGLELGNFSIVRREERIGVHIVPSGKRNIHLTNLSHATTDLDTQLAGQPFFRDSTRSHHGSCHAGR